jgi:hypothetical protein
MLLLMLSVPSSSTTTKKPRVAGDDLERHLGHLADGGGGLDVVGQALDLVPLEVLVVEGVLAAKTPSTLSVAAVSRARSSSRV